LVQMFYLPLSTGTGSELGTGLAQAVQCLTTGWTTGRSGFDPRQGQRIFPLASMSRPALGPTQPPVQWVLEVLSPGLKRGRGVTLTTHPLSSAEVVNEELYLLSPQAPPWREAGLRYFYWLRTTSSTFCGRLKL
jgi:hypothetical protein